MITNAVVRLLTKQRYYGELLLQMERIYSNHVPLAGVAPMADGIKLYINPDLFAEQTQDAQEAILIHECEHILRLHPARKGERDHKQFNVAADKAINQLIPGLDQVHFGKGTPSKVCLPAEGEELNKAAEYYYETEDTKRIAGDGGDSLDSHEKWGELSEELAEAVMKKAALSAAQRCAGNIPGHIQVLIEAMSANQVPWSRVLRRRVGSAMESIKSLTRLRLNRRFGAAAMGTRTEPQLRVGACIDVSGSVSDQEIGMYYSELKYLQNLGAEIKVLQADAEVTTIKEFKLSKQVEVTGRGGTLYNPALLECKRLGVDIILYFGDMDAADVPVDPGIPVVWISSRGQKPPADFGSVIYIEPEAA